MKTKTIILIIISALITSNSMLAQKSEKNVWYGPKIGLDLSTSTHNLDQISSQLETNYQIGGFLQFGRKLYFQPEAYFATYKMREPDSSNSSAINFFKAPLMIGYKLLDLGLISCHLSTGPTYTKEISGTTDGTWRWEAGIGGNILGFITTDIRYTFKNNDQSGSEQLEYFISNGGMVNLTVGLRLK